MKALIDILGQRKIKKIQQIDDKTIFFVFKKVICEEFGLIGRQKFNPDYFARKILFIKAENSVWSAELWTNKKKIIQKINCEIGESVIVDIKMK
jgi:hypothetical protein